MLKEVFIRALFYGFVITLGFFVTKALNKNAEKIKLKQIFISILLGIIFSYSVNLILGYFPFLNTNDSLIINGSTLLFAGFVAPIAEELIFRGVVFLLLQNKLSGTISIILSSAIFCVFHNGMSEIIYSFLLSVLLCFSYKKTNNIIIPIIIHTAANLTSICFILLG